MGRNRLTLEALVANRGFDATNHRHRRALDESGPLDDPELEELRRRAVYFRDGRNDAKTKGAETLRKFADAVSGSLGSPRKSQGVSPGEELA